MGTVGGALEQADFRHREILPVIGQQIEEAAGKNLE